MLSEKVGEGQSNKCGTEQAIDESKMINDAQFKSIIYLKVINGNRDK